MVKRSGTLACKKLGGHRRIMSANQNFTKGSADQTLNLEKIHERTDDINEESLSVGFSQIS